MKKPGFILHLLLLTTILSCNNSGKTTSREDLADSLQSQVIDLHDIAMPKSMRIPNLQEKAQHLIDSINQLPAQAQQALASYKAKLEEVNKELGEANDAMEGWMTEMNLDSARNNIEERIKYLTEEKIKVGKIKDAILASLAKADSLFKANP